MSKQVLPSTPITARVVCGWMWRWRSCASSLVDRPPTIGSGIAAIPLLMVKPWPVWPTLLKRPFIGTLTRQRKRASFVVLRRSGWLIESPGMGVLSRHIRQR